jgi:arylsulfatase A-like enzyme
MLEADIHVPFLVRGPGVPAGAVSDLVVTNIDIGTTILDLAGLPPAGTPTDGRSFAQALGRAGAPTPGHRSAAGRDRSVIEYGRWGTGYVVRGACQLGCGVCDAPLSRLVDAPSNVYSALRIANATHSISYAEFSPDSVVPLSPSSTNFTELYDLRADPWQLRNLALEPAHAGLVKQLSAELWSVANCEGAACP